MMSWDSYDSWKTACCEKYPDCSDCLYDNDYDDEEIEEEDEK